MTLPLDLMVSKFNFEFEGLFVDEKQIFLAKILVRTFILFCAFYNRFLNWVSDFSISFHSLHKDVRVAKCIRK